MWVNSKRATKSSLRSLIAIASQSEILFLDEPASALDIKNQDRVLSLIANLKTQSGAGIVFTTHQPNHALAADHTLILRTILATFMGSAPRF